MKYLQYPADMDSFVAKILCYVPPQLHAGAMLNICHGICSPVRLVLVAILWLVKYELIAEEMLIKQRKSHCKLYTFNKTEELIWLTCLDGQYITAYLFPGVVPGVARPGPIRNSQMRGKWAAITTQNPDKVTGSWKVVESKIWNNWVVIETGFFFFYNKIWPSLRAKSSRQSGHVNWMPSGLHIH